MSDTTLTILNKQYSERLLKVFNVETSDVLRHSNKDKQNSIMGSHHIMHEQFLRKQLVAQTSEHVATAIHCGCVTWRLVSANRSNSTNTANVNSSGYVNNNNANNANALAPGCMSKQDMKLWHPRKRASKKVSHLRNQMFGNRCLHKALILSHRGWDFMVEAFLRVPDRMRNMGCICEQTCVLAQQNPLVTQVSKIPTEL